MIRRFLAYFFRRRPVRPAPRWRVFHRDGDGVPHILVRDFDPADFADYPRRERARAPGWLDRGGTRRGGW